MFPKKGGGGVPQIIHVNRVFHDVHHPFWGTTIFGNTYVESSMITSSIAPLLGPRHLGGKKTTNELFLLWIRG